MHVFHVVVSAMSDIPKPITVNHDSYNIAPSSHPLASTLNFHCHSLPSRAYNYVTVNKQNLDTRHDLFFLFLKLKYRKMHTSIYMPPRSCTIITSLSIFGIYSVPICLLRSSNYDLFSLPGSKQISNARFFGFLTNSV